jgi:hypothetical protein
MDIDLAVSRETLDAEAWPACALGSEGQIVSVNRAWDRVASASGGPLAPEVLGTRWIAHITGDELQTWYADLLDRVRDSGVAESHRCDCNTPDRYRLFSTRFEPLRVRGSPVTVGVLVLASMLEEAPIGERYRIGPPDALRYLTPDGLIVQCSGCRRVRVVGGRPPAWELVPEYLVTPRHDVSHGLCRLCRELYYGMPAREGT